MKKFELNVVNFDNEDILTTSIACESTDLHFVITEADGDYGRSIDGTFYRLNEESGKFEVARGRSVPENVANPDGKFDDLEPGTWMVGTYNRGWTWEVCEDIHTVEE